MRLLLSFVSLVLCAKVVATPPTANPPATNPPTIEPQAIVLPYPSRSDITPPRYVIVSDPKYRENLQRFVDFKTLEGYDVQILELGVDVENEPEKIRRRLAEDPPLYILLIGDIAEIPAFRSKLDASSFLSNNHITDLYYAEYTGDSIPDAYVGRFPAANAEELDIMIDKTIKMSSLQSIDAEFTKNTILLAGESSTGAKQNNFLPQIGYIKRLYIEPYEDRNGIYPRANQKDLINAINQGASVLIYCGHGSDNGFLSPNLTAEDVHKMKNKDKYCFVVSNACNTNNYEAQSLSLELLRAKDCGAVCFIGATNETYLYQDMYWALGSFGSELIDATYYDFENTKIGAFDCFYQNNVANWSKWAKTAGELMYRGGLAVKEHGSKQYIPYYFEVYNILGDPSFMPYRRLAKSPKVEFVQREPLKLKIKTQPYTTIAISRETQVFLLAETSEKGEVELNLNSLPKSSYRMYFRTQDYLRQEFTLSIDGENFCSLQEKEQPLGTEPSLPSQFEHFATAPQAETSQDAIDVYQASGNRYILRQNLQESLEANIYLLNSSGQRLKTLYLCKKLDKFQDVEFVLSEKSAMYILVLETKGKTYAKKLIHINK